MEVSCVGLLWCRAQRPQTYTIAQGLAGPRTAAEDQASASSALWALLAARSGMASSWPMAKRMCAISASSG